jgi:uncharacterized protein involved in oxidation of intracellular sulfur
MKILVVINDPPYGTERVYNALRLAHALGKHDSINEITVFLMADAVLAAKAKQKTPEGFYNVERMLKRVVVDKGRILLCGTCMDARGIDQTELMDGSQRSTMDELAATTAAADKVLIF